MSIIIAGRNWARLECPS